jgi:ABC-type glycerol-3-phosphate transport system permease component
VSVAARHPRRRHPGGGVDLEQLGAPPVLIQKPDSFTVQLALSRFSTDYATDQGLTFAGTAIAILPPLVIFLVLQRSFIQGLTAGTTRR